MKRVAFVSLILLFGTIEMVKADPLVFKEEVALLEQQVRAVECSFAASMADRRLDNFTQHLDDEAIFIGASQVAARGKDAIVERWRPLYEAQAAPFSWWPETVAVLESGNLALSAGPVANPKGEVVSWYQSIWRKNAQGQWKIIFDRGQPAPPNSGNKPAVNSCLSLKGKP